jgi:hypothetical protein
MKYIRKHRQIATLDKLQPLPDLLLDVIDRHILRIRLAAPQPLGHREWGAGTTLPCEPAQLLEPIIEIIAIDVYYIYVYQQSV